MSQEANDILKGRSLVNRHLYQQKIADATEAQSERYEPTAYIEFDAEQGLGKVVDASGNIYYGNAQTNGAVGKGENVRLRRGGVIAGYDSMPCHKQGTPIVPGASVVLEAAFLFYVRASFGFRDTGAILLLQYLSAFTLTKIRQTTPNRITYEDSFTASFVHQGGRDHLIFGNVYLSSDGQRGLTLNDRPVRFFSPTAAHVIVNVGFTPGDGVISTHCGISIDKQATYTQADAYSNGTSISYETTVPAGEHYITCVGGYTFDTNPTSQSFSGNIDITVETITVNSFYIQKVNKITKLEDIITKRAIDSFGNSNTGSLVGYITSTKSRILAHIKYAHPTLTNNQSVYRYLLAGVKLTQEKFDYPEEIPPLVDDWQQEWTSTYLPDSEAIDTCINSLKNNNQRRFTNIFKNQMIALDLNQTINNQSLQNLIKTQNVTAKVEFSSYRSNEGSCTITPKKTKRLKLNKLIIPENVDISAVTILAVSVIVK